MERTITKNILLRTVVVGTTLAVSSIYVPARAEKTHAEDTRGANDSKKSGNVERIESKEINNKVSSATTPVVVVYFEKDGKCKPCDSYLKGIEQLAGMPKYADKASFFRVALSETEAATFGIRILPTAKFYRGGQGMGILPASMSKQEGEKELDDLLKLAN
jgi:thioredoxin-like negative regulator of GroEL